MSVTRRSNTHVDRLSYNESVMKTKTGLENNISIESICMGINVIVLFEEAPTRDLHYHIQTSEYIASIFNLLIKLNERSQLGNSCHWSRFAMETLNTIHKSLILYFIKLLSFMRRGIAIPYYTTPQNQPFQPNTFLKLLFGKFISD